MWTFLGALGCIISFLPAVFDHGKRKKAFFEATTKVEKLTTGAEWILVNWMLPIIALVVFVGDKIESNSADKQISDATNKIEMLTTDFSVATNDLAKAKRKTDPRIIDTPERRADAKRILEQFKGVPFGLTTYADSDAERLGEQVKEVLMEVGWRYSGGMNGAKIRKDGKLYDPIGVLIEVNRKDFVAPAMALNTFFINCQIDSKLSLVTNGILNVNTVSIQIGPR